MTTRIVIQHVGGSKANQVEQFPIDSTGEMTIGREPGSTILFDATRDDTVSRKHASIIVTVGDPPMFQLLDHGSRNGTMLNGTRIQGESELMPGDLIELGTGGAKFKFDVDPRPANITARTRMIETATIGATRGLDALTHTFNPIMRVDAAIDATVEQRPIKAGVGRDTVMHMLSEQRHTTSRTAIYVIAALLVIVGSVGGGVYYRNHLALVEQNAKLVKQQEQIEQQAQATNQKTTKIEEQNAALRHQIGVSPQAIMDTYGNATVLVKVSWRAYDKETGKPVFHKTWCPPAHRNCTTDELLPAYIYTGNKYVRWLTTDDDNHTNYPVGGIVQGSGFLINDEGFILTNRHIAVSWKRDYSASSGYEQGRGVYFDIQDRRDPKFSKTVYERMHVFDVQKWESEFRKLLRWTPAEGGMLFADDQPVLVGKGSNMFEGKNESISMRFPGAHSDVEARLVRNTDEADLALLKVDAFSSLVGAPMAEKDDTKVGEPVTVLGYPSYASKRYVRVGSIKSPEKEEEVVDPTVTTGSISKQRVKPDATEYEGVTSSGDMYQMTVTVGPGSSGGPVFNSDGKVIGVLTAGSSTTTGVAYAVPISYVRLLTDLQPRK